MLDKEILKTHIGQVLIFWKPAVDWDNGGIHYVMDDYGRGPAAMEKKCLLMHARQLYDFSVGTEFGIEGAAAVAKHLFETFDKVFPQHEGLYISYNISDVDFEKNNLSAYDLYFAVIGMARYAKAFSDRGAYEKAKSLFAKISDFFKDDDRGFYTNYDTKGKKFSLKSGNTFLHKLEAINTLALAAKKIFPGEEFEGEKGYLIAAGNELYLLFESKIYVPEISATLEGFDDEMNISLQQRYGYITNAHPMEWFGFWQEYCKILGQELPFFKDEARKLVDAAIARSKTENGCFGNNYYLQEKKTIYVSSFWSQTEAVLGFAFAFDYYKDDKYRDWAEKLFDFYLNNYIDNEFGGIFSDVSVEGVIVSRSKGYSMKCDYHCVRMAEKILHWNLI